MFEGLFGPWHLLIVAVVVFVVVGPRKMAASVRGTAESVQRLVDPDEYPPDESAAEPDAPQRARLSYRLGRRLRRRR
ncbi:MAG: twin-arginine translocase TatA/TatE family subunit [Actinomycetota bacterium]|nr:twin-arginine translocase TatA/TatE family subunit [Actinomycetota bacterium]